VGRSIAVIEAADRVELVMPVVVMPNAIRTALSLHPR